MIISPENTTYKFMLKFPTPPLSGNSNCKCNRALTATRMTMRIMTMPVSETHVICVRVLKCSVRFL